jgi:hypothetical protein
LTTPTGANVKKDKLLVLTKKQAPAGVDQVASPVVREVGLEVETPTEKFFFGDLAKLARRSFRKGLEGAVEA